MIKQQENKLVWYWNKDHQTMKCVAEVVSIPEGQFDVIKTITLYPNGTISITAVQHTEVERFFNGYSRVATAKQVEKAMSRILSTLDGDVSQFTSKWEN